MDAVGAILCCLSLWLAAYEQIQQMWDHFETLTLLSSGRIWVKWCVRSTVERQQMVQICVKPYGSYLCSGHSLPPRHFSKKNDDVSVPSFIGFEMGFKASRLVMECFPSGYRSKRNQKSRKQINFQVNQIKLQNSKSNSVAKWKTE